MDNSTAPPLAGALLQVTQLELVTPTTVAGTLYGIAFTLFCLYVHALAPRLRGGDRTRQAIFMLTYGTVVMLCGMYLLVSNAWIAQDAYIKHSDYLGGPYLYISSTLLTSPVVSISICAAMVIDVLTSAIQVWRVWVIWSATRLANFVTVLPVLCFLTFTGLKLRSVVLQTTSTHAEINVSLEAGIEQTQYAIQVATTLLCTVLISGYLTFKHWQQRKLIGKSQGSARYMNVVAMIVESYAVESIWLLITEILWNKSAGVFFSESGPYIEIIAYLLLQYQVASGKAHELQRGRRNISSLRWNHSNHATMRFGETGEIQEGPRVPVVPDVASVPQVSSMA